MKKGNIVAIILGGIAAAAAAVAGVTAYKTNKQDNLLTVDDDVDVDTDSVVETTDSEE